MGRGGFHRAISSCTNQALCEGKKVLVHCINGKHRSTQVAATCLRPFHPTCERAMEEVFGHTALLSVVAIGSSGRRRSMSLLMGQEPFATIANRPLPLSSCRGVVSSKGRRALRAC